MACNDRQLTEAQRQAGFGQQRSGVNRAIRPFSGSQTLENLIDYVNRELGPALRATRDACNDVFLQVADNAPSANPLAFYFSTSTAAADPTVGRMRLNQAVQNTATVIRVSESNGRLQSVQPWLDVMSGGPTTPLGTLTMVDAINPSRFLRFDLNTMTDQGRIGTSASPSSSRATPTPSSRTSRWSSASSRASPPRAAPSPWQRSAPLQTTPLSATCQAPQPRRAPST
jgi:hypothetical protein